MNLDNSIYAIIDTEVLGNNLGIILKSLSKLLCYGVEIFQFRAKGLDDKDLIFFSRKMHRLIRAKKRIFIINDRCDIAILSKADGVHLGSCDIPAVDARKILGPKSIIGKTIHSLKEYRISKSEPLDYLSFGPVFKTETKPMLKLISRFAVKQITKTTKKTTFAIGGINQYNISSLSGTGIRNIALCRGILDGKITKNNVLKLKKCLRNLS
ncbi:MAG: thiamine phosphate synthase [Candidatus Omnitrophota bacterium]